MMDDSLNSPTKIILAAGGTGGHVFPAQGLAEQLSKLASEPSVLFVAGGLSSNRYFQRDKFAFEEVSSSSLPLKKPLKFILGLGAIARGVAQSIKIINRFQPDLVIGFGSYYAVPIILAAKIKGIPILLHEANSIPGQANRWLAPLASCIGVHFPSTIPYFKKNVFEVGLPLREGYSNGVISQELARDYFGLEKNKRTLLIFGGSQGAKSLNTIVSQGMEFFKNRDLQLIHLVGSPDAVAAVSKRYKELNIAACVKAFESKMERAWSAADFFIGRSGASTLAEAMEFEKPGILIPFPFATDLHQDKNAQFLVNTVKGGIAISENQLTGPLLAESINTFMNPINLERFQKQIQLYQLRPNRMNLLDLVLTQLSKEKEKNG